jgi:hypothetical protein
MFFRSFFTKQVFSEKKTNISSVRTNLPFIRIAHKHGMTWRFAAAFMTEEKTKVVCETSV